ncbi:uncharacterized protein LY89DRAFT_622987, partial [Mollisia scopiformis]
MSASSAHGPRNQPCKVCQQRKVKCDRKDGSPCINCTKMGVDCILVESSRRKKNPPHYSELLIRLKRFEDALRGYGADVEKIARGEGVSRDNLVIRGKEFSKSPQSPGEVSTYLEKTNGTGLTDQFYDGEEILQSSSDIETLKDPIMATYDAIFNNGGDRFAVESPASDVGLLSLHPSPVQIFRLWQIFLDRINPLTKIIHAPTTQQRILEASSNLDNVPKSLEALMFSIYYFAATSLTPEESETLFGQDQTSLTKKYWLGFQQALANASFLKSSDIVTLQAFVLYLNASIMNIDPRTHYSLVGLAIRITHRMGLDRDGSTHTLPPFQTELRRRLWYQIVLLDLQTAQISGGGSPLLHQPWDTKLPLNINDSDLYPEMTTAPPSSTAGATEMVFCLIGYEIASYLHTTRHHETLSELESRLKKTYLKHLNPTLKFHQLTIQMAHSTLSKTYMTLHHNRHFPKTPTPTPAPTAAETQTFFTHLLTQLSSFNSILTLSSPSPILVDAFAQPSAQIKRSPYHWYAQKNFPFAAQILLLLFLRTPMFASGEERERAWRVLNEGFFLKRMGGSRLGR